VPFLSCASTVLAAMTFLRGKLCSCLF
jgi:hypothetical protein